MLLPFPGITMQIGMVFPRYYSCRITCHDGPIWYILHHNSASTYCDIIANPYMLNNADIGANVNIITNSSCVIMF
ncbi:hypothetical protein SAMN05216383_11932 [Prevotella sp. KH2C16]|nr:hypothetical protein SAMN05216383_11932 [Prevotella sp. KH2C16]